MKKEKDFYKKPDISVTSLFAESIVCYSNYGAQISATKEEEDSKDWNEIN